MSKKQKPPAYQHYAKDFLTGTAGMSCAEVGAYIRLLDHCWDGSPVATLPDNDEQLRRMAGAEKDEWKQIKDTVLAKFERRTVEGKRLLVNDRMMDYWKELVGFSESKSKAAHARWDKDKKKAPEKSATGGKGFEVEEPEDFPTGGKGFDPEEA